MLPGRPQQIVADAPFPALIVTEQTFGGHIEQPPAPAPKRRIPPVDIGKDLADALVIVIEARKPLLRGARIVHAVPTPVAFDGETVRKVTDQPVTRHDAAGEEMPCDPV